MRVKDRARKTAMKSRSSKHPKTYKHFKNKVTSCIRKSRTDYFKHQLDSCSNDPKAFWKIIKNVTPKDEADGN